MKSLLHFRKWAYLFSTIAFWGITFTGMAQCGGPSFPAPAEILANVPEASGYNLVYDLPIPSANQAWATQADIPYAANNSAAFGSTSFTRVAYYLKLESASLGVQWVWVSMNAFTTDISRIAIPTGDILYQQQVSNMNVLNNSGVNRTGVNGNIEFWSPCYNPANAALVPGASDALNDFGDEIIIGDNCYGSFQVHDYNAMETLLAYNGWAYSGFGADDLGIGNCTFCSNPDWTTASNANYYDVKELYVFVNSSSFQPQCNSATLSLNAGGSSTLTPAMVTTATTGSCGVTDIQLSKTTFTCADRGANTVTVTFTVNGNTYSCNANVTVQDNINPVITATGTGFTLSCNPSAAAIEAALGTATATDNCGTPTLSFNTPPANLLGGTWTQTRTWTASDGSNTITTSRTVTWPNGSSVPVITPSGTTLTLSCNPTAAAIEAALGTATATAGCGTPSLTVNTPAAVLTGGTWSQTRTWTAVNAGNTVTASRTVTWPNGSSVPVINATGTTLTLSCNPTAAAIEAALGTATASASCGVPTLTVSTAAAVLTGNTWSRTRTWTAVNGSNTTTLSRTVTWPKDILAPVITPTGSALSLGCNPTAAAIEAALGTATATDNCGTATLTVNTPAVVVSGDNRSQTRTWTAVDGSSNSSTAARTATWTVNCGVNTAHTFASSVNCDDYNDGAAVLANVCYKAENRKVKKVSPKSFYYYTHVTTPATLGPGNSFYIDIIQSKSCSGFNLYGIQGNQVRAYDSKCKKVENGSEISTGQGRVKITNALPGKIYTISVKYETKSLEGSTYTGNTAPVCENSFLTRTTTGSFGSGTIVPGSQGVIKAMPDCYTEGHDDDEDEDDDDDRMMRSYVTTGVSDEVVADQLTITASPNPSPAGFTIAFKSNDQLPLNIRVLDTWGRSVFTSSKTAANSTLKIGAGWPAGTYFAEIRQGAEKRMIKLVKQ